MLPGPKSDIDATSRLEDQRRSRAILICQLKRKSKIIPDYSVNAPQYAVVFCDIGYKSKMPTTNGAFPSCLTPTAA